MFTVVDSYIRENPYLQVWSYCGSTFRVRMEYLPSEYPQFGGVYIFDILKIVSGVPDPTSGFCFWGPDAMPLLVTAAAKSPLPQFLATFLAYFLPAVPVLINATGVPVSGKPFSIPFPNSPTPWDFVSDSLSGYFVPRFSGIPEMLAWFEKHWTPGQGVVTVVFARHRSGEMFAGISWEENGKIFTQLKTGTTQKRSATKWWTLPVFEHTVMFRP